MFPVIGSRRVVSDAQSRLVAATATTRRLKSVEETFRTGTITRAVSPIIKKLVGKFIADNFKAKKDKKGGSFKAINPKKSYRLWCSRMIRKGTKVYVGSGGFKNVKHPGTPNWAGRRTDFLWEKMFKNKGKGLSETMIVNSFVSRSRLRTEFTTEPTDLQDFVNEYPAIFFARGNDPFFITKEQGQLLRTEVNKLLIRMGLRPK